MPKANEESAPKQGKSNMVTAILLYLAAAGVLGLIWLMDRWASRG